MELERIRRRLRRIEGTTAFGIRQRVGKILLGEFGAKFGAFLKTVHREGTPHWASITTVGDTEAGRAMRSVEGEPHLSGGLWNPWEPRTSEQDQFVSIDHGPVLRKQIWGSTSYRQFYEPFGIDDHARVLLYDGRWFVGWLGLLREEGVPFSPDELAALNELVDTTRAALVAAENLEGRWEDYQLCLVVDPDTFLVEFASRNAATWLTPRRYDLLRSLLREFGRGEDGVRALLDGFEVHVVELVGERGTRYHVNVTSREPPRFGPDVVLTPRQREVAECVIAGGTNREIADWLGISPETVKQHLKDIYERLRVANRLELVELLHASENPRF